MSIEDDKIKSRLEKLEGDVKKVTDQIQDLEKKKIEAVALLNALQGAKQQCQMFLQEINNEDSTEAPSGSIDNGTLGGPAPTAEEIEIQKAKEKAAIK
jgi:dsDNA-specific endonuclease/ATPase MutS2